MYYYGLFVVFATLIYATSLDENLSEYILLLPKYLYIKFYRFKWWLFNNPSNPIVRFILWRKYNKMAKELIEEFKNNERL